MLPPEEVAPALSKAWSYLHGDRLALFVGHGPGRDGQEELHVRRGGQRGQDAAGASWRVFRLGSRSAAWAARCAKAMIGPRVAPPAQ